VSEVKAPPQRWLILGVLVLTFMCSFAYAFAVTQPSVGILSEVFGLDPGTVGGLMMLALSIAAAVMSIPAGILTDKWGVKKTGILAVALLLIGWLISGIATDFTLVLVGRALIGLGGVTISIVGPPALLGWFPPTEIGTAMGVWSVAMPLGLAWEIPFATWVMLNYGWQSAYLIGAVFSLVFLGLYALLIRPGPLLAPPPKPEAGAQPPKMSEALANPEVWKFSLSVLFTIMVFQSINAFFQIWTGTRLAEEAGMAMSDAFALAGSIAGFIGLTGIFGVLISGILSDKLGGRRKPIYILAVLLQIIPLLMIAYIPASFGTFAATAVLMGLFMFLIPPQMFAIPTLIVRPEVAGLSLGIVITFFYIAGIIGPMIVGGMALTDAILFLVVCCLIGAGLGAIVKSR